jgi:cell division ATPase FtsA
VRNEQSVYNREQAFGGNQLTADIVSRYGMSPEEAENAKRSGGLPDDFETEVLRPFMENLSQEVQRALQFFFTSTSYNTVDHILLAGGSAVIPGLEEIVHTRTSGADRGRESVRRDADLAAHSAQAPDAGRAVADCCLRPGNAEVRPGMSGKINLLAAPRERRKRARTHFRRLMAG